VAIRALRKKRCVCGSVQLGYAAPGKPAERVAEQDRTANAEDGLWHQLIDHPEAWSETSGTGIFTFAMVSGVKNGWLDSEVYGPAARNAWLGLVKHIDQDGNVSDVCVGTDKKNDLEYYLTRPRRTGDLHGQAPVLWTVSALLR